MKIIINILKIIQKIVFFFFLFFAVIGILTGEFGVTFMSLIFCIIVYPTFYKMFLKNDWANNAKKIIFKMPSWGEVLDKVNIFKDRSFIVQLNDKTKLEYYNILSGIEDGTIKINKTLKGKINKIAQESNLGYKDVVLNLFKSLGLSINTDFDEEIKGQLSIIKNFITHLYEDSFEEDFKLQLKDFLIDYWIHIIEDFKITDEENDILNFLINKFQFQLDEIGFDQNEYNRYRTIYLIEDKGELPDLKIKGELPIIPKKGEKIYWMEGAVVYKKKMEIVKRASSSDGISINLMAGVSYKLGSYNAPAYKEEVTLVDDSGFFIITNQRVGFIGDTKNFWINYDKVINFTANEEGLVIMKENTSKPYIVSLGDYNLPLLLLSKIINDMAE
ncbi:hypothetical protein A9Q91_01600 [Candidatus Gracilibacteria bacterium 28_42_T64]|nr:hypothetical protein A9Q91_01600 [Candidatus Gracilibacteria bacterium 28_42_T64]